MPKFSGWLVLAVSLSACSGGPSVGAACMSNGDCGSGLTCNTSLMGGYCTADCTTKPCGGGQTCTPIAGGAFCLQNCGASGDCRTGYQCWTNVCLPPCTVDADCGPVGVQCVSGQCMPLPGAPLGASCMVDMDCSSRTCFQMKCMQSCTRESQCGSGNTCTLNPIGSNGALTPTSQIKPICIPRRGKSAPGAACVRDADCDIGSCQYGICV